MKSEIAKYYAMLTFSNLREYERKIYAIEDIFLFNNKRQSIEFLIVINLMFFAFWICHFSCYTLLSIAFIAFMIIYYKYSAILIFIAKFVPDRESNKETGDIISIERISAYVGIFVSFFSDFKKFIFQSIMNFNLYYVAVVTLYLFTQCALSILLGDTVILWLLIHIMFHLPMILFHRIGFKIINFPYELEHEIISELYTARKC